jgi:integrase
VDEGLIVDNPAANLPLPEIEQDEMRILTDDEIWRLAQAMHPRYRSAVLLAAFCGLRLGELLALRWGQVDLVDGRLRVVETMAEHDGKLYIGPPKTKATVRSVPLPDFVMESLVERSTGTDADTFVFGSSEGYPLRPGVFRRRYWNPAVDQAGLAPLSVRDLRDTAVAIWIAERAHPEQIVALAGMSSISVLFRLYGHLYREPDALVSALEGRAERRGGAAAAHETASAEPSPTSPGPEPAELTTPAGGIALDVPDRSA